MSNQPNSPKRFSAESVKTAAARFMQNDLREQGLPNAEIEAITNASLGLFEGYLKRNRLLSVTLDNLETVANFCQNGSGSNAEQYQLLANALSSVIETADNLEPLQSLTPQESRRALQAILAEKGITLAGEGDGPNELPEMDAMAPRSAVSHRIVPATNEPPAVKTSASKPNEIPADSEPTVSGKPSEEPAQLARITDPAPSPSPTFTPVPAPSPAPAPAPTPSHTASPIEPAAKPKAVRAVGSRPASRPVSTASVSVATLGKPADVVEPPVQKPVIKILEKGKKPATLAAIRALDPNARYEISAVITLGMKTLKGNVPRDVYERLERATNIALAKYKEAGRGVNVQQIEAVYAQQENQLRALDTTPERAQVHRAVMGILFTAAASLGDITPIAERSKRSRIHTFTERYRPDVAPSHAHSAKPTTLRQRAVVKPKASPRPALQKPIVTDLPTQEAWQQLVSLLNPTGRPEIYGVKWLNIDGLARVTEWTYGSRSVAFSHLRSAMKAAGISDEASIKANELLRTITRGIRVSAGTQITVPAQSERVLNVPVAKSSPTSATQKEFIKAWDALQAISKGIEDANADEITSFIAGGTIEALNLMPDAFARKCDTARNALGWKGIDDPEAPLLLDRLLEAYAAYHQARELHGRARA